MLTRREFAAATVVSMLVACGLPDDVFAATEDNVLAAAKANAAKTGCYIGCQADRWQLEIPQLAAFVAANFSMLTAGNQLKWIMTQRVPDKYDFTDGDWMVNFAESHGMKVHGHNLCSNGGNPGWFAKTLTKQNAEKYLTDHIRAVAGRYKGRIDSWDVVNEPIAIWMKRPDGLYPGPWLDLLGPGYIDLAFHTAASVDPKAMRVLNVHHVESDIQSDQQTRVATMALISSLLARRVPIQAIGLESHVRLKDPFISASRDAWVREIRDLGLEVLVTELDINDSTATGLIAQRDAAVGDAYATYIKSIVPAAKCKRLIFWTICDQRNWMDGMKDANYKLQDGSLHRPGLLPPEMKPGIVLSKVEQAIASVWPPQ
jgi:endo-1,4-beta-xylanase